VKESFTFLPVYCKLVREASPRRLPQAFKPVILVDFHVLVPAHEDVVIFYTLVYQHPVKRVFVRVFRGEEGTVQRLQRFQRNQGKADFFAICGDVHYFEVIDCQFAEAVFQRDFPQRNRAYQDFVADVCQFGFDLF